jgi:hypothetical protein
VWSSGGQAWQYAALVEDSVGFESTHCKICFSTYVEVALCTCALGCGDTVPRSMHTYPSIKQDDQHCVLHIILLLHGVRNAKGHNGGVHNLCYAHRHW